MNKILTTLAEIFKSFTGSWKIEAGIFKLNYGAGSCAFPIETLTESRKIWDKFISLLKDAAGRFSGEMPADQVKDSTEQREPAEKPYIKTKSAFYISPDGDRMAKEITPDCIRATEIIVPLMVDHFFLYYNQRGTAKIALVHKGLMFYLDDQKPEEKADEYLNRVVNKMVDMYLKGDFETALNKALSKRQLPAAEEQPRPLKKQKQVPGPIREILETETNGNLYKFYEWEADHIFEKQNDLQQETCTFSVNGFFYQGLITITQTGPFAFAAALHETGELIEGNKTNIVNLLHIAIQTGTDKKTYRNKLQEWISKK